MPKVTKDAKLTNGSSTSKQSTIEKVIDRKQPKSKKKTTSTSQSTIRKTTVKKNDNKKKLNQKVNLAKKQELDSNIIAEYYDLPYRYNETIVKILYQTPSILFVYWDVSDDDKSSFVKQYGENFFSETYPILKIYNLTKHYEFELPINDFANSWYVHVKDAGDNYQVKLFRKPIKNNQQQEIYISTSNSMEFPNDHILLEQLPNTIHFRNVKTNELSSKEIATLRLVGVKNIRSVHDFYQKLYKEELLEEINQHHFINPSSSSW